MARQGVALLVTAAVVAVASAAGIYVKQTEATQIRKATAVASIHLSEMVDLRASGKHVTYRDLLQRIEETQRRMDSARVELKALEPMVLKSHKALALEYVQAGQDLARAFDYVMRKELEGTSALRRMDEYNRERHSSTNRYTREWMQEAYDKASKEGQEVVKELTAAESALASEAGRFLVLHSRAAATLGETAVMPPVSVKVIDAWSTHKPK
jgi:hypothetical protein